MSRKTLRSPDKSKPISRATSALLTTATFRRIRSNALQLRLAYGRIDWNVRPNTDIFFEGGQDWTIFGSSALMNLFETTFYGAYWGNLYERSPQFRLGVVEKLGGSRNWRLSPEVCDHDAVRGRPPGQCRYLHRCTISTAGSSCTCRQRTRQPAWIRRAPGRRLGQNPRSNPGWFCNSNSTRLPASFPHRFSGAASTQDVRQQSWLPPFRTAFKTAFPRGYDATSNGYGNQLAVSLPTRWFTVVASGYQGADLRFFFGGETLSNYNQAGGLTGTAERFSVDRSSTVVFGTNAAGQAVAAPQLPVRGYGGFVQVGFPLSRWFNADPKGRNAGWQAYVEYGIDAANANDFRYAKDIGASTVPGPSRTRSKPLRCSTR